MTDEEEAEKRRELLFTLYLHFDAQAANQAWEAQ
jgi:hypothetical protein